MIERTTKFVLTDYEGREHLYNCRHFNIRDRFGLQLKIARIGSGTITRAIQALAPAIGELGGGDESGAIKRFGAAAGKVNWDAFSDAIMELPVQIAAEGGFDLVTEILRGTTRERREDSAGGAGTIIEDSLDNETALDVAYGAANTVEMYQAMVMIVAINISPFGKRKSTSWSELWGSLTSALPVRSMKNTGTDQPRSDS